MNEKSIRCPKGPAVIFLINAISNFSVILNSGLLAGLLDNMAELPTQAIIRLAFMGIVNLFMSIVLFSKSYNNLLLAGTGALMLPYVSTLFRGVSPGLIVNIIFYLLLMLFTYIMVNMTETYTRKKAVKVRFIIPTFQFVLILISTIQSIQNYYESFLYAASEHPDTVVNMVAFLLPAITSSIIGFLPVLCYIWLVNWLADPKKK